MDGTMRERLARVLESRAWAALGTGDTLNARNRRTASLRKADAVLDAMRSPDEAMIDAGIHGPQRGMNMGEAAAATFTAMIDAARTPAKES